MLFSKIHNNKKPSSHSKVSGAPALLPPLKILLLQACQWINSYELVSRSQFWNYHFNIIGLRDWKFTLSVWKFNIGCGFRSSIFLGSSLRILNLGLSNTPEITVSSVIKKHLVCKGTVNSSCGPRWKISTQPCIIESKILHWDQSPFRHSVTIQGQSGD